jgi:hypothetical protein
MTKKITAQEVLNSIPVPNQFTYDRDTMLMYKLGVLSGWLARLAREDVTVRQELRARQSQRQPGDSVDTVRKAE